MKNQKGYPVLPKAHQALIFKFMGLRTSPWIILCDVAPIQGFEDVPDNASSTTPDFPSLTEAAAVHNDKQQQKQYDLSPQLSYMRNLQQRQPSQNALERFEMAYQDYLQAPLQPLTVNLESITYEVFEKDPIKYEWYERAIARALQDWFEQKKPGSGPNGKVVVAVVGAGRGPLVTRALRASAQTGVDIDMWALEKNPNAFVLLQGHNCQSWNRKVSLVQSDMRSWKGPFLLRKDVAAIDQGEGVPTQHYYVIDILISELLGSFGDNELSPECLDGVTHLLNPVHGISIPASYSSHLTPISSPRLYADVMALTPTNPAAPETPYVVKLHAIDFLSAVPPPSSSAAGSNSEGGNNHTEAPLVQTAWSFSHPNKIAVVGSSGGGGTTNAHNVRESRLRFPCQNRGVCHGLAGYFESVLYQGVELSTNPVTMDAKSANMISWFPIYFPLKVGLFPFHSFIPSFFLFYSTRLIDSHAADIPKCSRQWRTGSHHVSENRRPKSLVRVAR